jgi:hypothetical protein
MTVCGKVELKFSIFRTVITYVTTENTKIKIREIIILLDSHPREVGVLDSVVGTATQ